MNGGRRVQAKANYCVPRPIGDAPSLKYRETDRPLYWPDSDGLVSTVAMHGQTSVCSAISSASSTSIPS